MPRIETINQEQDLSPEQVELAGAALNKPIPGQSLTNSPDEPYPWERPPRYTNIADAATAIFADMTEEDNFVQLMTALKSGTSVADIASVILYRGFQLGQFNPDMLVLLVEPVMYMIMALAERVGLGDILGYEGEQQEEDFDPEEKEEKLKLLKDTIQKQINSVSKESLQGMPKIQREILEFEPSERVKSLLAKDEEVEEVSLLERS
tara:strand:+ start:183 stop:803 length:621 start_codon:yes stop_codon:yes gene_type:complete